MKDNLEDCIAVRGTAARFRTTGLLKTSETIPLSDGGLGNRDSKPMDSLQQR